MPIVEIDKEAGAIVFIYKDGTRLSYSVVGEDCVVSVPPAGYKKVHSIYVDPTTEKLYISYEE